MFGLDFSELAMGGGVALSWAILGAWLRNYYKKVTKFHHKWKTAVAQREQIEEEKDTEIVGLQALLMAYDGVFDRDEEERLAKQARDKQKEDWRIRNARGMVIDRDAVKKRIHLRRQGYTEQQILQKMEEE